MIEIKLVIIYSRMRNVHHDVPFAYFLTDDETERPVVQCHPNITRSVL